MRLHVLLDQQGAEDFFYALDAALGQLGQALQGPLTEEVRKEMLALAGRLNAQRQRIAVMASRAVPAGRTVH